MQNCQKLTIKYEKISLLLLLSRLGRQKSIKSLISSLAGTVFHPVTSSDGHHLAGPDSSDPGRHGDVHRLDLGACR